MLDSLLDVFGGNTSALDKESLDAIKRAREEYEKIKNPEFEVQGPEALYDLGGYNPNLVDSPESLSYDLGDARLADIVNQGDSSFNAIESDPRLRSNQVGSIDALNELAASGGLNSADRANLARIQSENSQADRGRREAILQNLGARGMGGSGMELLSQLQSSQAATDRASQEGLDVAGQAQDRALNAIMQSGQLSGQVRGQDFEQAAEKAAAQDAISRFNAQNINSMNLANAGIYNQRQADQAAGQFNAANANVGNKMNVNQANQAALNASKAYNSGNAQRIADQNVSNRNAAQGMRNDLYQQNFDNLNQLAAGKTQSDYAMSDALGKQADRKAAKAGEMMGAVTKGVTAYATGGGSLLADGAMSSAKKKGQ